MTRAFLFTLLLATPALAGPPHLALPIDCALGESCFIQNYVDADPGTGFGDFACGALSYDGHKGTDFALLSDAAMTAGVSVRSAAPGVVRATRDAMPDLGLAGTPSDLLQGKDCGNGVVVDHGDGWETQYCHMKQGSIAVRPGDAVTTGTDLGEVGFSGRTEFPHLHLSLRHAGRVVDPFNADGVVVCGGDDDALWADPIDYVPGGLVSVGLASAVPEFADIKSGGALRDTLPTETPALVGWAQVFGGRSGDDVEIALTDPNGSVFFSHVATLDRDQARLFRAAGKKAPSGGWDTGDWTVIVRLIRDGAVFDEKEKVVRVGP